MSYRGYVVTPKGKVNTGSVINSNCYMHKDTGPETDVFVIDKPCSLLLCHFEGCLLNFVLSYSRGHEFQRPFGRHQSHNKVDF